MNLSRTATFVCLNRPSLSSFRVLYTSHNTIHANILYFSLVKSRLLIITIFTVVDSNVRYDAIPCCR